MQIMHAIMQDQLREFNTVDILFEGMHGKSMSFLIVDSSMLLISRQSMKIIIYKNFIY